MFRELRALTNDKSINVNPMELNDLYDNLWNIEQILMTDRCLELLDDDFRPWPKFGHDVGSERFYAIHDHNKVRGPQHVTPLSLLYFFFVE